MSRVLNLWAGMTGVVFPFAGTTAPSDWLMCFGQAVSHTTYANLFAKIGTAYGAGDGSTTFNVPDMRGRVCAGVDNMGGTAAGRLTTAAGGVNAATLGASGGAGTHTLTTGQIPAHGHTASTASSGGHSHTASSSASGNHTHSYYRPTNAGTDTRGTNTNSVWDIRIGETVATGGAGNHAHTITVDATAGHSHLVTVNANTGGDGAHPIVQPTIALNYIIKV